MRQAALPGDRQQLAGRPAAASGPLWKQGGSPDRDSAGGMSWHGGTEAPGVGDAMGTARSHRRGRQGPAGTAQPLEEQQPALSSSSALPKPERNWPIAQSLRRILGPHR